MSDQIISGANSIDLIHCLINPEYMSEIDQEHISVITGQRNYLMNSDHRTYKITEFLFKYSGNRLSELEALKDTFVYFRPKNEILQNRSGGEVRFYLETIKPFYLDRADRYGACIIILKSEEGISKIFVIASYGSNYGTNYGMGF